MPKDFFVGGVFYRKQSRFCFVLRQKKQLQ